jgi:uncharacterized protein YfaP (DUF2135 family)
MRTSLGLVLVSCAAGTVLAAHLARAEPVPTPPLSVRIEKPLGGQTSDRVVAVEGTVSGATGDRLTIVANGIPLSVPLASGRFAQSLVLSPGLNSLRAVVEQGGTVAEDSVALHAQVPAKDLRVTLTWDTATDVDLWVTGPDGEVVMYSHRQGKAGGVLDTDITSGFGPETYTQARLQRGTYRIQANAYSVSRPTRLEVTTVRFEGTPDEERKVFRSVLLRSKDTVLVGEFAAR